MMEICLEGYYNIINLAIPYVQYMYYVQYVRVTRRDMYVRAYVLLGILS